MSCSGQINTLDDHIEWVNIDPFDNEDAATSYIENKHEKWEPPLAVPFKHNGKICYAVGGMVFGLKINVL